MRTFKYETDKWYEILPFALTDDQKSLLTTPIGDTLETFDPEILKQKLEVQLYMENCRNTPVVDTNITILNSIITALDLPTNEYGFNLASLLAMSKESGKYHVICVYQIKNAIFRKQVKIEVPGILDDAVGTENTLSDLSFLL